eukprot:1716291-Amphidinium_carterae.2
MRTCLNSKQKLAPAPEWCHLLHAHVQCPRCYAASTDHELLSPQTEVTIAANKRNYCKMNDWE